MSLPNKAHVRIGSIYYKLDEAAPIEVGRPPYRHWSRSLFSGSSRIAGKPGAENINPDQLLWELTRFDGEGQTVMDPSNEASADLFYRSEGLDFRTPGQFGLNKSRIIQSPADGSASGTTTVQGSAWLDITGTSSIATQPPAPDATDRRISLINDEISSTSIVAPGAGTGIVDFNIYQEGIQYTTIEGSAMTLNNNVGSADVPNTLFSLIQETSSCITANLTGLAASPLEVNWYAYASVATERFPTVVCKILNVTDAANVKIVLQSNPISVTSTSTGIVYTDTFTPVAGKKYAFVTRYENRPIDTTVRLLVDKITYGLSTDPNNSVRVVVYNQTAGAEVAGTAKTIYLTNTSTANVVSLTFASAAATDYRFRVRYAAGKQRPIVDSIAFKISTTGATPWSFDDLELGMGGNVWLLAHRAGSNSQAWWYNFSTETWTLKAAVGGVNTTTYAMCHSDKYEYMLMSDGIVYRSNGTAGAGNTEAHTAAMSGGATGVGMCISQNRIMVLCEDPTNGVTVRTFAVDGAVPSAQLASVPVTSALNTADTALRQRMVSTPTGGRFYVNYSDVTCKIYECNSAGPSPIVTEIGGLDIGAKATAICYVGGQTFIAGQFLAESTQTPRSALWMMDQNNIVTRVGYFRRDAPDSRSPVYMVPYQNDLWILQGNYMWRYSLVTGGLYLEQELLPLTPANQMALGVTQGHQFAVFSNEGVYTIGSVSAYRQAGSTASNQYTSSISEFGLPGISKVLDRIDVITDTLPANVDVKLEYQKDQSGTWVSLGSVSTGTGHRIRVSSEDSSILFTNLQLRITLGSKTGANTPVVKDIVVRAFPAEFEEFFDLILLCNAEDSAFHIDGQQAAGGEQARSLRTLWATSAYTTLTDGYENDVDDNSQTYLVRVESFAEELSKAGEGRVMATLRVITV